MNVGTVGAQRSRSLFESIALVVRFYGRPWLIPLFIATLGIALGALLHTLASRYGDLGLATLGALLLLGAAGATIALRFPGLVILACVAVAFSNSSATLAGDYGLPLPIKYLPLSVLALVTLQWLQRLRLLSLPLWMQLQPRNADAATDTFRFCLTMLGVYLVLTLIPVLYAEDLALAFDELNNQYRRVLLSVALALAIGQFGTWSSLRSVCTIALYATAATVFLAMIGSFDSSFGQVFPGFMTVHANAEFGDVSNRIAGAYGHPNSLGRYAVFMMPFAVCLAALSSGLQRMAALACLLVLFMGVILSESRGALLVLAVISMPVLLVVMGKVKVRYWLPVLLAGVGVVVVAWQFVDSTRMMQSVEDIVRMVRDGDAPVDGATRGRLSEMRIAYELWKDHPFRGIGLANYEHFFQMYSYDFGTKLYNDDRAAHSFYLELLAERGILGLVGFLFAIGGIVLTVLRVGVLRLRGADRANGFLAVAMVASAVAYYLSAVLLHDVHSAPIWGLIGLMIASTRHPVVAEERLLRTFIRTPEASR